MRSLSHVVRPLLFAGALLVAIVPSAATAQNEPFYVVSAADRDAKIPRAERPVLVVMPFAFAAVLEKDDAIDLASIGIFGHGRGDARNRDVERQRESGVNLGKATADLLVAALLETGQFRLLERTALQEVLAEQNLVGSDRAASGQTVAGKAGVIGARYIVTGSITKFGRERNEKSGGIGGLLKRGVGVGSVNSAENSYIVGVTLRVVETATGEVVASVTSDGEAKGGRRVGIGVLGGGIGGGAGGIFNSKTSGEREKKIGEAVVIAVSNLVDRVVEKRVAGELVP